MKTRAAIAWEPNRPLEIEELDLDGPRDGEVLVRIVTTSLCHTDVFTLSGEDPEGLFPCVLGHEGCGIVEEIGKGVTSVKPGDHVIPLYVPEDPNCPYIKSGKTNLCQTIRKTQGAGLMPDGISRFSYKAYYNIPKTGNIYPKILIKTVLSRWQQCFESPTECQSFLHHFLIMPLMHCIERQSRRHLLWF